MKIYFLLTAISFLSFVCFGQSHQDKDAVKNVVIAFQEDYNDGSFKNADAYATNDWEHINPLGGIDRGRDSTLKKVRAVHQGFLKGRTMLIENMDVRFVTPDVAIAVVIHKINTYTTPDGVKHENERNIKTYVIVRKREKWLLTHDHNTKIQDSSTTGNQK